MPRPQIIKTEEYPYHIRARVNNREDFSVRKSDAWSVFRSKLGVISAKFHAQVISFVLMSNHWHMLLMTPLANVSEIMNFFMGETSRDIAQRSGRINHVYGARYKWSVIGDERYLAHAYKYVYQNPLRAGLSERVEDYAFSTLCYLLTKTPVGFPIHDDLALMSEYIPDDITLRLNWLNASYRSEENHLLRRSLRRARFEFSRCHDEQATRRKLEASLIS